VIGAGSRHPDSEPAPTSEAKNPDRQVGASFLPPFFTDQEGIEASPLLGVTSTDW